MGPGKAVLGPIKEVFQTLWALQIYRDACTHGSVWLLPVPCSSHRLEHCLPSRLPSLRATPTLHMKTCDSIHAPLLCRQHLVSIPLIPFATLDHSLCMCGCLSVCLSSFLARGSWESEAFLPHFNILSVWLVVNKRWKSNE